VYGFELSGYGLDILATDIQDVIVMAFDVVILYPGFRKKHNPIG
jgi:hypothetical protein